MWSAYITIPSSTESKSATLRGCLSAQPQGSDLTLLFSAHLYSSYSPIPAMSILRVGTSRRLLRVPQLTIHTAPALRAKAVPRVASLVSKRNVNDLSITSPPNPSASVRPAIRYGPPTGGRSSDSGRTVAVFGSTGFLARYLIQKLARQGTQVIVPYRDEDEKRRLRPCGDLGQIVPLEWDARVPEQTAECVKHADVVYNLVGRDYETR